MGDDTEPQIGALLRLAWTSLQADLYEGLRRAGFGDLRDPHRPVLRYPPIDGMRPGELAVRLGLSKQATNDLLRDLERLGYLRLERDHADGRARLIRYTDRGWRLYEVGSAMSRDIGQRWRRGVGADRYDTFAEVLREIVDLPPGDDA